MMKLLIYLKLIKYKNFLEKFILLKSQIFFIQEVINKIRNFYYSTEKPEIKQKYTNIVIHIRRGDVTNDDPKNKKRFIQIINI